MAPENFGSNRYNAVINIELVRISPPPVIAQNWLRGSQKAVKKMYHTYFPSQDLLIKNQLTQALMNAVTSYKKGINLIS